MPTPAHDRGEGEARFRTLIDGTAIMMWLAEFWASCDFVGKAADEAADSQATMSDNEASS